MEIHIFAPVLIPTLNRYDHLKRCVESLARCTHAENTELVLGIDYPPSDNYLEGWEKISRYVPTIKGFKKVTVFNREYNYGPSNNSSELRKYAREHYDRFITTEDDNEFAPNFLDYMNKGLEHYKGNPKIFGICGYNYLELDMSGYSREYYFSHEMNAWGWGSWFDEKFDLIQQKIRDPYYLYGLVKNVPYRTFLSDGTKRCTLLYNIGKPLIGDGYYTYYEWNNDMYCVFPTLSLVRNHGYDGSGVNCGVDTGRDFHSVQKIDYKAVFESNFDIPIKYDNVIRKKILSFQTGNFKEKIKRAVLLALLKIFIRIRKY